MLCDPGSEYRLGGGEKKKGEGNKWDGKKETPGRSSVFYVLFALFALSEIGAVGVTVGVIPSPCRDVECCVGACLGRVLVERESYPRWDAG